LVLKNLAKNWQICWKTVIFVNICQIWHHMETLSGSRRLCLKKAHHATSFKVSSIKVICTAISDIKLRAETKVRYSIIKQLACQSSFKFHEAHYPAPEKI